MSSKTKVTDDSMTTETTTRQLVARWHMPDHGLAEKEFPDTQEGKLRAKAFLKMVDERPAYMGPGPKIVVVEQKTVTTTTETIRTDDLREGSPEYMRSTL